MGLDATTRRAGAGRSGGGGVGRGGHRLVREHDLLAGCDAQQTEAITTTASPLCVLAGAGSGKTRVLTRRIAFRVREGSALAPNVLALTFTRKAAGEMRGRLLELGLPEQVTAGTFHAVALSELKRLAAERGQSAPVVLASKVRLLAEVAGGGPPRRGKYRPAASAPPGSFGELAQDIEWAKARCVEPGGFAQATARFERQGAWPPELVDEMWARYETEKRRRRVLDFEDLLQRCRAEMIADAEFAASARWRFRHLFVDEYQDVNTAQQRLLETWLGPNDDLCVVGDPHQAIYAWNGSNPRAISEFPEDFPGATVLDLSTNYRSTRELLRIAGAVLGLSSPPPAGGPCPDGPIPTVTAYVDEVAEARGIAAACRLARRPGRAWSQIAVLARTNAQLSLIETALSASGVPSAAAGAWELLGGSAVRAAVEEAARAPDIAGLAGWAADLAALADEMARAPSGSDQSEPGVETASSQEAHDLATIAELAREYMGEDVSASGRGFRNWLEATLRGGEALSRRDKVELTTFHRAKGLEWAVVILAGLESGFVPIAHASTPEAVAEERRLLYVACTRASEELHCSWAVQRTFGDSGRPMQRRPSPWLAAIEAAHLDLVAAERSSGAAARRALAESRRALGLV